MTRPDPTQTEGSSAVSTTYFKCRLLFWCTLKSTRIGSMRHKSQHRINIKLSSVTRVSSSHLSSPAEMLDCFHFVDCRDLISVTIVTPARHETAASPLSASTSASSHTDETKLLDCLTGLRCTYHGQHAAVNHDLFLSGFLSQADYTSDAFHRQHIPMTEL